MAMLECPSIQPEQLSMTETGVYRQHVEGFEPVTDLVRNL